MLTDRAFVRITHSQHPSWFIYEQQSLGRAALSTWARIICKLFTTVAHPMFFLRCRKHIHFFNRSRSRSKTSRL